MPDKIINDKKIFLIGFMGSGKSHWGKLWSKQSDLPFFDLDEEIEKTDGASVAEIFVNKGEPYFRKIEKETLQSLIQMDSFIISCGGGTPCYENNMQLIKNTGTSIYLKCTNDVLFNRLLLERDKRPLISELDNEQLQNFIDQKVHEREAFYLDATLVLEESEASEIKFQF